MHFALAIESTWEDTLSRRQIKRDASLIKKYLCCPKRKMNQSKKKRSWKDMKRGRTAFRKIGHVNMINYNK